MGQAIVGFGACHVSVLVRNTDGPNEAWMQLRVLCCGVRGRILFLLDVSRLFSSFDINKNCRRTQVLEDAFLSVRPRWALLDAYTPTVLRADMHGRKGDGLHYCIPGPLDHWVSLLYNMLLVETSATTGET